MNSDQSVPPEIVAGSLAEAAWGLDGFDIARLLALGVNTEERVKAALLALYVAARGLATHATADTPDFQQLRELLLGKWGDVDGLNEALHCLRRLEATLNGGFEDQIPANASAMQRLDWTIKFSGQRLTALLVLFTIAHAVVGRIAVLGGKAALVVKRPERARLATTASAAGKG